MLWAGSTLGLVDTISSFFITYTLGLMHETSFQTELFPVWATFLIVFFRSSDSFSAYNGLEDNDWRKNYHWQRLFENILLAKLLSMHVRMSPMIWGVMTIWGVFCLLQFAQVMVSKKAKSLLTAQGYDLQRSTKLISDYMSSEHQTSDPCNPDPIQMRGYNYVVRGEETTWVNGSPLEITDEVVTVVKVWACQGSLLCLTGGDKDGKLKDICLSFSLYKLLSLRFCSYSLPKEAHKKLWKLIRNGLLEEKNGYERAFRVIELELSFRFDLLYTKCPIIFQPFLWQLKVTELLLLVIGSQATIGLCFASYNLNRPQDEVQLATSGGLSIDVLVTSIILMLFTFVQLGQLFFMAISEWAKVSLLCKYVQTPSWHEKKCMPKLIGLICRMPSRKPWERKLRQYSLLESHGYTPPLWLYNRITAAYIDQKRDGKLSWACRLETQTQVIIVWHIATSICEHEVRILDSNFLVASSLSKYLAYLVAFSPQLLPNHPYDSEFVFDKVIIKSRKLFKGCMTGGEKIPKLKEIGNTTDDTSGFMKWGAQLGQQLLDVGEGPNFIWKVLAEFWAELMVYVAPSDDAKAHAEHLVMGGEFVTHLWALVSHAGMEREPPVEQPTLNRSPSRPN
ncbi:hypothetical protein NL676_011921 [Syzygium grande]|nr:hypothetical protein NL676_011921 [Syzygium grande]